MSLRHPERWLGAVTTLFLTGVAAHAQEAQKVQPRYTDWWLPDQASTVAGPIDDMFYLILWITSAVFVGVFVTQIYFMIRYRRRDGGKAIYSHGNNRLEIAWTILPALILVFLGVISQSLWSEIKQQVPADSEAFTVELRPRQFQWDVRYSGSDGKFGTADDINAINNLHVPIGKPVLLNMTAQDVIHSFFVPEFRMKQDAVPGMMTQLWFTATKTGEFEIACAELCGLGHYRMRGKVFVHSQQEFDTWYAGEKEKRAKAMAPPPAPAPTAGTGNTDSTQPPPRLPGETAPADTTKPPANPSGGTTPAGTSGTADTNGSSK